MLKSKVESYLGKNIEVTLDCGFTIGNVLTGILKKTDDCLDEFGKPNYYLVDSNLWNHIFKSSHIKKIKEIK